MIAWGIAAALVLASRGAQPELYDVVRVVDGDTIWIRRFGVTEKLRLLSVDTEEKITGRVPSSRTKPETVFGEETALWTREFFEQLGEAGQPARVRLVFPEGREERDIWGRLLCHVVLADGRDFNLLLVQLGKSPYFNKYGDSRIRHADFVAAQHHARRNRIGIWNERTNAPSDTGAPAARRPYAVLLAWWQARAEAISDFRSAQESDARLVAADDPESLARVVARSAAVYGWIEGGAQATVFGQVSRFFEEQDGSLTVLFRSSDPKRAFRVSLPAATRGGGLEAELRDSTRELAQNFLLVRGRVYRGARGFRMVAITPAAWHLAGPQPERESLPSTPLIDTPWLPRLSSSSK